MEKTGKLAEALALRPELQLTIAGVADAVADGLALRTAELDKILELRTTELAATSDPSIQYADLRRMVLEQLYREQLDTGAATQTLEELQMQFTTLVPIEGQDQPAASFDSLAYANELRRQLIDSRVIDENDLASLATARAEALKTALLAIDESLQNRVLITENKAITREDGGSIEMQVILGAKAD
jgi:hypothetical protein